MGSGEGESGIAAAFATTEACSALER
jgi:hypothetical protein